MSNYVKVGPKKVSGYDQGIPQSQTADKPMAPQTYGTANSIDSLLKEVKENEKIRNRYNQVPDLT